MRISPARVRQKDGQKLALVTQERRKLFLQIRPLQRHIDISLQPTNLRAAVMDGGRTDGRMKRLLLV